MNLQRNHQRFEVTADVLGRVPLLAQLGESARTRWSHAFKGFRLEPNFTVVSREEAACSVYFVVSGWVQATAFSQKGRQIDFDQIGTGDMFGEIAAIDGGARSVDVVTMTDTLLLELSAEDFRSLVDENPNVRWRLVERLTSRVRSLSNRVYDLTAKSAPERIREALLRKAQEVATEQDAWTIDPAPTDQELANCTGSQREAVNREVNRLASLGVLERLPSERAAGRWRIAVYRPEALGG